MSLFFFSSRRRHTRCLSDWSSDVCSSDLCSWASRAMALIQPAQRIALLAHEHPDGDCIGSALGLAHILRQLGKFCVPVCADPAPRTFFFLPGVETLQQTLGEVGYEDFDLVIALDAGELERFGA